MKKLLILLSVLVLITSISARNVVLNSTDPSTSVDFNDNSISSSTIIFNAGSFDVHDKNGYDVIEMEGLANLSTAIGRPEIPVLVKHIAVPDNGLVSVRLKNVKTVKLSERYNIHPRQAPLFDYAGYEREFEKDEEFYSRNEFFPEKNYYVSDANIMRDVKFVKFYFTPFRYNPATGELTVITSCTIDINIDYSKNDGIETNSDYLTDEFTDLYRQKFDNFNSLESYKPVLTRSARHQLNDLKNTKGAEFYTEGDLLIIVGGSNLYEASKEYAAYKAKLGYQPVIHHLSNYSSSTQIRNDVIDAYTNWTVKPVYVLIMGDADSTLDPSSNFIMRPNWKSFQHVNNYTYGVGDGYVPNDHWMSLMTDTDYYSDVFIGRFNVNNLTDYQTIMDKIIEYETNPDMTSSMWFTTYVGLGAYEDGRIFDTTATQFWRNLEAYGWSDWDSLIESDTWTPSNAECVDSINDGFNILLFRGHGAEGYDGDGDDGRGFEFMGGANASYPTFYTNEDIGNISNGNEGGFIFAPTCLAGNFAYPSDVGDSNSMGDYWTHYTSQGGAGYFGSTNVSLSYYNDSMSLGVSHAITGDVTTRHFGRVSVYGKNYMETYEGGDQAYFELEMYLMNILGDPSTVMYSQIPKILNVSHDTEVETGTDTLIIQVSDNTKANVQNAYVTIYDTLESPNVHESQLTDAAGEATFYTDLTTTGIDGMFITVTKQDYASYTTGIDVIEATAITKANASFIPGKDYITVNLRNTGYDRIAVYRDDKFIGSFTGTFTDTGLNPATVYKYELVGISGKSEKPIGEYEITTLSMKPVVYLAGNSIIYKDIKGLSVIDISGRIYASESNNKYTSGSIDISSFPSGIYFAVTSEGYIKKLPILLK